MRNPLAARYDEHRWDRAASAVFLAVGVAVILWGPGTEWRGWFSGLAFVMSLAFVLIYRRRTWRSTYAGRATMIAMCVTTVYTGHATAILVWRYGGWETAQALVYLFVAYAVLYKLRALTRSPNPAAVNDPTTDMSGHR